MYTLFIDTHGELITVALYDGKKIILKTQESHYEHAKYVIPMINDVLKDNGITVKNIKDIVSINGPGSFTGLRIGLSISKTMAYALNIPIYLISTLVSYIVSDKEDCDKVCIMEDNKGYYVCEMKDGNVLEEEYVIETTNYRNMYHVPLKLDVVRVIEYAKKNTSIDAHLVRANYVKRIEVEK